MARRTRRPRVVWLPPSLAATVGQTSGVNVFGLGVAGGAGDFVVGEQPIVNDIQDPLAAGVSLADVENSGYRLRRIVGKVWVRASFLPEPSSLTQPSMVVVTAGIIVRRTDTAGASLASLDTTGLTQYPGDARNWGDPWIWRRSWLLSNREVEFSATILDQASNNYQRWPGAVDGPHVDQKTARIIGPEERLFLNVSATIVVAGTDPQDSLNLAVLYELRCLGSMRTSAGNRRNASR